MEAARSMGKERSERMAVMKSPHTVRGIRRRDIPLVRSWRTVVM